MSAGAVGESPDAGKVRRRRMPLALQISLSLVVVAAQLSDSGGNGQRVGLGKVQQILTGQGIAVVRVGPRGRQTSGDDRAKRAATEAGVVPAASLSATVLVDGVSLLVESRAVDGGAVALVAPLDVAAATRGTLQRRV